MVSSIHREYHENGKLRYQCEYVDGVKNGPVNAWYEDGTLHLKTNYLNGLQHGLLQCYRQNGALFSESPFHRGKLHGLEKEYSKNGKLLKARYYWHDKLLTFDSAQTDLMKSFLENNGYEVIKNQKAKINRKLKS